MKRNRILLSALLSCLLLLSTCSKDKENPTSAGPTKHFYSKHDILGTWMGQINTVPLSMPLHLGIILRIDSTDTAHLMYAVDSFNVVLNPYPPPDTIYPTIFRHLGHWTLADNVARLIPDTCEVMDTTTGQLVPVDTATLRMMTLPLTVSIDTQTSGAIVWSLKVADLWPFFSGLFTVPPNEESMVKGITLGLIKQ